MQESQKGGRRAIYTETQVYTRAATLQSFTLDLHDFKLMQELLRRTICMVLIFRPFQQTISSDGYNFLSNHYIYCYNILLKITFQMDINRLEGCPQSKLY